MHSWQAQSPPVSPPPPPTSQSSYLPTFLPSHLPIFHSSYLPVFLLAFLHTFLLTFVLSSSYLPSNLLTHLAVYFPQPPIPLATISPVATMFEINQVFLIISIVISVAPDATSVCMAFLWSTGSEKCPAPDTIYYDIIFYYILLYSITSYYVIL